MTSVMWCVSQSSVLNNTLLPAQYMYNWVEDGLKLRVKWLEGWRRPSPCEIQNALQVGGIWFKAGYKSRDALNICFSPLQMYPMYADQIVSLTMFLWAIGLGGCEVETHNLIIKAQSPCNTNNHATLRSVPPFPELHSLLVFGACIRLIWLLLIQHVSTKQVKLIWQCLGQGTPQSD